MNIVVLTENTTCKDNILSEHGLSILIKTKGKKILFDLGQSDLFLRNAKTLNENLKDVDYCVISHGHYDHGGGLKYFLEENKNANVYIHEKAFDGHFSQKSPEYIAYIGIDKELENNERIKKLSNDTFLSNGICTMTNVEQKYPLPLTNKNLLIENKDKYVLDNFVHEQDLVVEENGYILFVGCSHSGIKNILEHFKKKYGCMPKAVIGGLHLSSRTNNGESEEFIKNLGEYLKSTGAKFYTCHCTGVEQYKILKRVMGDKITYISAGSITNI